MGSMRDERLTRMWGSKKVTFMRPDVDDGLSGLAMKNGEGENRDLGRGSKNCVHESMIPDCGRGGERREEGRGAGDCRERVTNLLEMRVKELIQEARDGMVEQEDESATMKEELETDYSEEGGDEEFKRIQKHKVTQQLKLIKPKEVLVRLRNEHSGFSTLNNQRFGSKFVGDVANPTDMLLFSKKQTLEQAEGEKNLGQGSKQLDELLAEPIDPDENEEVNVEDLVYDVLHLSERKLELLTEESMAIALDNFVSHNETGAIEATVESTLAKNQKDLMDVAGREEHGQE
ncbi:hypothetical protein ScalyP_jg1273 [Parmales sp. scaly parma]|nr:hypothetical protein ScalyP_jg1273 [Parmales sp. scaly parma]